ncbi:MAG: hypothetical protein HQM02_05450 [Magnetococcales bacterium]|nr:hypothetical protein [Magnetococcales bacterium]
MGTVTADIQIPFQSFAEGTSFALVVDGTDQEGNRPVIVDYESKAWLLMQMWGEIEWKGAHGLEILKVKSPGEKRVKLYCPNSMARAVRIFVDNDTRAVQSMGRRHDEITEALTWNNEVWKRLQHPYDTPSVTIIQQTTFRDRQGKPIPAPKYDRNQGGFFASQEAFGALVVRYKPGYSLFKITYDAGEKVASSALFAEMQKCWLCGDISKASVPPVRLVAISDRAAVSAQFERSFWPRGFPGVYLKAGDVDTLYVETKRETETTNLLVDESNPEVFVKVEEIKYIEGEDELGKKFRLRMQNHAVTT